jgi:hypothetical protein
MVLCQKYLAVSVVFLLISSCGLVNEDEVFVPAYLAVPSFTFETTPGGSQGANSEAFNDVWISDAGILLGTIGTPAILPIQKRGSTEIRIDAGISNTGQANSRNIYPFIASFVQIRDLKPGVIDTIRPVFKYIPATGFKFIEDFDRISRTFEINTTEYQKGDTIYPVNDANSWQPDNFCGKIELAPGHLRTQLVSKDEYLLEGFGTPTYLEIDYKSNLPMDIGYYYFNPATGNASSSQSVILTFPTNTWKKLYIDLTNEVSSRKAGSKFVIYIGLGNPSNVTPSVYIDNVKLVYLK